MTFKKKNTKKMNQGNVIILVVAVFLIFALGGLALGGIAFSKEVIKNLFFGLIIALVIRIALILLSKTPAKKAIQRLR